MAKETSIENFNFDDDNDFDFSTPTTIIQDKGKGATTTQGKASPLPDFEEDNSDPVNLDKDSTLDKEESLAGIGNDNNLEIDEVDNKKKKIKKEDTDNIGKDGSGVKKKKDGEEVEEKEEEEDIDFDEDDDKPKPKDKTKSKAKENEAEDAVEEDEEGADENEDDDFYTVLMQENVERGIFQHVELEKGKQYTEEEYFEATNQELDARNEEFIEAFTEGLDDDAKAFIKYKKEGGDTQKFLQGYQRSLPFAELDITNEKQIEETIMFYLTAVDEKDMDEAADFYDALKNKGKHATTAQKYFDKIKAADDEAKENVKKENDARNLAIIAANKKREQAINAVIDSKDEVKGLTLTKQEKVKLKEFFNKATEKVGKDKYMPAYLVKLNQLRVSTKPEDVETLVAVGKLLNNNFDLKDIKVATKTEVVSTSRNKLKGARGGIKLPNKTNNKAKEVWEHF